jgi:oxygen-independent coproporphyrinogen-3 oxidase
MGIAMKETNFDFPYHQTVSANLFLYPPPKPVSPAEKLALAEKLGLEEPMSQTPLFTVFASIPYCRSRCHSCHFFKGLLPRGVDRYALLNDYLDCLETQIQKYAATVRFSSARCGAVYLGGGTASLLAADQVDRYLRTVRQSFVLAPNAEITLEGNPLDYSLEYLQRARESGVTRLSLGIQSFQDAILKVVGTSHDGRASREAAKNACAVGFPTVNIDLLYKLPGQTIQDWSHDLQTALDFEPESITFYAYVIHTGSAAEQLVAKGRLEKPINMDEEQKWYLWTSERLEQHGYVEKMKGYFSRPEHEKMYGVLNYQECCDYIGLGTESYSFINGYQFHPDNDTEHYKEQVRQGLFPIVDYLSVPTTHQNTMERYVMFNFFSSSLSRQTFFQRFGQDPLDVFPQVFAKLEKHKLVVVCDQEIKLTALGKKWRENVLYEFYSDDLKDDVSPEASASSAA